VELDGAGFAAGGGDLTGAGGGASVVVADAGAASPASEPGAPSLRVFFFSTTTDFERP
jgi:hypothetical protein